MAKRYSQPQGRARIDWSNPITAGMSFAWTPNGISTQSGAVPTYSGSGTVESVGKFGSALKGGAGGDGVSYPTGQAAPSVANGMSFLLVGGYDSSQFGVAATSPSGWLRNLSSGQLSIIDCTGGTSKYVNVTSGTTTWAGDGICIATSNAAKTIGKSVINGVSSSSSVGGAASAPTAGVINILQSISGDRSNVTRWNANGYLVAQWNRALSDAEIASLSANPWQIFAPSSLPLWKASAGGGTTYTITPSGTLAYSGTTTQVHTKLLLPSGLISFLGNASITYTPVTGTVYTLTVGGFITYSGMSNSGHTKVFTPAGTTTFSGSSIQAHTRSIIPQGTILFSGSSLRTQTKVVAPNGTILYSGTAPMINPNAIVYVTTWRSLTGMGL